MIYLSSTQRSTVLLHSPHDRMNEGNQQLWFHSAEWFLVAGIAIVSQNLMGPWKSLAGHRAGRLSRLRYYWREKRRESLLCTLYMAPDFCYNIGTKFAPFVGTTKSAFREWNWIVDESLNTLRQVHCGRGSAERGVGRLVLIRMPSQTMGKKWIYRWFLSPFVGSNQTRTSIMSQSRGCCRKESKWRWWMSPKIVSWVEDDSSNSSSLENM